MVQSLWHFLTHAEVNEARVCLQVEIKIESLCDRTSLHLGAAGFMILTRANQGHCFRGVLWGMTPPKCILGLRVGSGGLCLCWFFSSSSLDQEVLTCYIF